nr:hypothetical protein GCM10020185_08510 [Pseudomonas brassicacearum subsp. brassicacearum]
MKKHVLHFVGNVAIANAHTISMETACGAVLQKGKGVFFDNYSLLNINVYCADGRSVVTIPCAEENPKDIIMQVHR